MVMTYMNGSGWKDGIEMEWEGRRIHTQGHMEGKDGGMDGFLLSLVDLI